MLIRRAISYYIVCKIEALKKIKYRMTQIQNLTENVEYSSVWVQLIWVQDDPVSIEQLIGDNDCNVIAAHLGPIELVKR